MYNVIYIYIYIYKFDKYTLLIVQYQGESPTSKNISGVLTESV